MIIFTIYLIYFNIAAQQILRINKIFNLFKGEKRYLEESNQIYQNSTFLHTTNPFEIILNETINIPYKLISLTNTTNGPLFLYQIREQEYRIHHHYQMLNVDFQFNCSQIQIFESLPDSLIFLLCFNSKFEYIIINYLNQEIVDNNTLNDNFINPIFQLQHNLLFIGDNFNTENWRIVIFTVDNNQLNKLTTIESSVLPIAFIEFSLHYDQSLAILLISKSDAYLLYNFNMELTMNLINVNLQQNCEYHKRSNGIQNNFIYKCGDQYFGEYNITNKINGNTKIVLINDLVLYLNENELFFEDPLLPSIILDSDSMIYYRKMVCNSFYYYSQNRLYEYKVNQYVKYLYSIADYEIDEIINIANGIQLNNQASLPINIIYFNNIQQFIKMELDTIQFPNITKKIQNSDNITLQILINYLGIQSQTNSSNIQNIQYQSQCVPQNVDFYYLIKFVDIELRPDQYFEGVQFGTLWLVQIDNQIQFATCYNSLTLQYFPFISNFTHFYQNESCLIVDIFTFRIDNVLYILQYDEKIYISTHISKIQINQIVNYQNCVFATTQNITYVSYRVDKRNLQELQKIQNYISDEYFFIDQLTNKSLDQLLNKYIEQPVLHIISIIQYQYERIIVIYEDKIENYIIIQGQILHCFTFSFKQYILNFPQYKLLQVQNPPKYSISNENIAIKVNSLDQQFIYVFNFNSTFLQCLEQVIQSNSNTFILSIEYLSILDQNQITNYYKRYLNFKFNSISFQGHFFKTMNFSITLQHYMNNYKQNKEQFIFFIDDQKQITQSNLNYIFKQNGNKISFQIEDFFHGPLFQVQLQENIQLVSPLHCIKNVKLNDYEDLSLNKSMLLLKQNQIFTLTNYLEENEVTVDLIIPLNLNLECFQIKELGNILVVICKKNSILYLCLYLNFIFQSLIEFNSPYITTI